MRVKCLHESTLYPLYIDGGWLRNGRIYDMTKKHATYYAEKGWIEILKHQPRGAHKISAKSIERLGARDLSDIMVNPQPRQHVVNKKIVTSCSYNSK